MKTQWGAWRMAKTGRMESAKEAKSKIARRLPIAGTTTVFRKYGFFALLSDYEDEVVFVVGHLSIAIEKTRKLARQGVELVIARGETANVIREEVPEVIVVAVPISGIDLAMALEQSRAYGKSVAVVSFPSMINRVEELAKPLSMRVLKFELPRLPTRRAVERMVDKAVAAGADVILGGFSSRLAAEKKNVPSVFIPPNDEAYRETFHTARSILHSIEQDRLRSGFIAGVLDYALEGIVSVDQAGMVSLINPVAQRILKCRAGKAKCVHILNLLLPPLRERRRDIPSYAQAFIGECAGEVGKNVTLSAGALRWLERMDWPGNIRELRNMMERIVAISNRENVGVGQIKSLLDDSFSPAPGGSAGRKSSRGEKELREALEAAGGSVNKAADALGVNRVTLWRRMGKHGINKREYRD